MLEEVKEGLIAEINQKMQQPKQLEAEIKKLFQESNQKYDEKKSQLLNLSKQIKDLNNHLLTKLTSGKQINTLMTQFDQTLEEMLDEQNRMNSQIENLYHQIYDLSHNSILYEQEMKHITEASTLEELGLTMVSAQKYIKSDDKKVIRAIFKDIKEKPEFTTSSEIEKALNMLYQTNASPFVKAMQNLSLDDLILELMDIGIIIDSDKVQLLKNLIEYAKAPNSNTIPIPSMQERTDRLDNNFYNMVEQDFANMQRFNNYPPIAISRIVTNAILTSIAKAKKIANREAEKSESK